jgi:hypothetical protein
VSLDIGRQGRAEFLNPAQDGSAADFDTAIRQQAGDAFGRSAELQVVANGEQDDVTREAMT